MLRPSLYRASGHAGVGLGRVIIISFIHEFYVVGQRNEAVAKTSGDEELLFVFFRQLYADPLLVCRAVFAQVYGYVENGAASAAHQLGLTLSSFLEMDAPQRTFYRRRGVVILYEIIKQPCLLHLPLAPAFHKESPVIAKYLRLQNNYAIQLIVSLLLASSDLIYNKNTK